MNKKIQSQVLKENPDFFWDYNETKESKSMAQTLARYTDINEVHKSHNNQMEKAISRTIELMEEEYKNSEHILRIVKIAQEKQKADFRKMIDCEFEKIILREFSPEQLLSITHFRKELLAKLGTNNSSTIEQSSEDKPEAKTIHDTETSDTSKGCGNWYLESISKNLSEPSKCGTHGLCESCQNKKGICICGDNLNCHFGFINDKKKGGKCNKCKCKKFEEDLK